MQRNEIQRFFFKSLSFEIFFYSKYIFQVSNFLVHPPNLEEDQIFEWSKRVEPRNMESLVAEFINNEMEMMKVLSLFGFIIFIIFC